MGALGSIPRGGSVVVALLLNRDSLYGEVAFKINREVVMKSIKNLLDDELARLILTQVWRFHDSGGISMGRTPENRLVEAAMELLPEPEGNDRDRWTFKELLEEADERIYLKRIRSLKSP